MNVKNVTIVACLGMMYLSTGSADVFYWQGGNGFADFTDSGNWKVLVEGGALAETDRIPGATDRIWTGVPAGGAHIGYFDMGGGEHTVAGYSAGAKTDNWKTYYVDVSNGTLTVVRPDSAFSITNGCGYLARKYTIWDGGTLIYPTDTVDRALASSGLIETWTVKSGGRMELYGRYRIANGSTSGNYALSIVEAGGEMVFAPEGFGADTYNRSGFGIDNYGTFLDQKGFVCNLYGHLPVGDATVGKDRIRLRQMSGRMLLGGDFAKTAGQASVPAYVSFELVGGRLEVTNDVSFYTAPAAKGSFGEQVFASMPDGADAILDVKANSSIDMSIFTFGENAKLLKTGPGRLKIRNCPAVLNVEEGTIFISPETDLSRMNLSPGVTLGFTGAGIELDSLDNAGNLRFTVSDDFPALHAVLTSSDADLLETVKSNFDKPSSFDGYELSIVGNRLMLLSSSQSHFVSAGESDLGEAENWTDGSVPENSAAVIRGEGTIGVISGSTPAFSSITVAGGGTLRISASHIDLPEIRLEHSARLILDEGVWASLSNGLECVATSEQLPVFEISTNATLAVPGATEFKNVDLHLYGLIDVEKGPSSDKHYIAFGSSRKSGEVVYFAMTCIGGTVRHPAVCDYGQRFVYSENGGRVRVVRPILLKDYRRDLCGGFNLNGPWFGYGNPSDEEFEVVIDGSDMEICRTCSYSGNGTLRFVNGSRLISLSTHPGYSTVFSLGGKIKLIFEDGAGFVYPRAGSNPLVNSSESGVPAITLGAGGYLDVHALNGNSKAVLVASNGVWCVDALPVIPYDKLPFPPDGDVRNWITEPFTGLQRVDVKPDSSLVLASANRLGMSVQQDRFACLPDVPIAGAGGLVVSNGVAGYGFTVVMTSGGNEAGGTLKVHPSGDPTMLLFNDGANWAGTVEGCERVSFTNLVDAAAPASVEFGALELTGDFPVRFWKDGASITNDMIALGSALSGNGRIVPVSVGGKSPVSGDFIVLGAYPAEAGIPDANLIYRAWRFETAPTDNPDVVLLGCRYMPKGTVMVVR